MQIRGGKAVRVAHIPLPPLCVNETQKHPGAEDAPG